MSEEREDLITAEEAVENQQEEQEDALQEVAHEEEVEETHEEEVPVGEEVEKAKKYGHLSKEEWKAQGRDPNQWKSPEEFNKTGKILEQLYSLRDKIDQRDREIKALVEYQQRTSQREYDKAKKDLESKLAASKDDMDMEGVAHYTKELTRLQDMEEQNNANQWQQLQQEAQQRFMERNQHWFNDRNPDLKARAVAIDNELKSIYPNATFDELAQKIEARMQYEFPERILGEPKKAPPAISPSRSSVNKTAVGKNSVDKTFRSLSSELKDTYAATKRINESIDGTEYTKEQFIAQLKEDGEL